MKHIPLSLTLIAFAFPVWATDIDFKGVKFGATEKAFISSLSGYSCKNVEKKDRNKGDRICNANMMDHKKAGTFADLPAIIQVYFYEDKLAKVWVRVGSEKFSHILDALTERYGKPDRVDNAGITNRMGGKFQNVTAIWRRGDVMLEIEKYGPDLDWSGILYRAKFAEAEFEKRTAPQKKKAARDL